MNILTITVNPAIDKSTKTSAVTPGPKIRCAAPYYEPGGGGINVARALKKLGTSSTAMYFAGGAPGEKMRELLDEEGIQQEVIETREPTRENLIVLDSASKQHYRFGMPGPSITEDEYQKMLDVIDEKADNLDFIVASGSLPESVPDDFFGRIARVAKGKKVKFVLDTSKEPLVKAVEAGVFLLKPNKRELKNLMSADSLTAGKLEEYTKSLVSDGNAEIVVVSLGSKGAFWADKNRSGYIMSPVIEKDSPVGAGDSMVAGIVHGLINFESHREAVIYGIAAGTAATITPGTELCRADDTENIAKWIREKQPVKQHV